MTQANFFKVITPLMLSLEIQELEISSSFCLNFLLVVARILLEDYKANPNKPSNQLSPLHVACMNSLTDIVNLLLKNGANVNQIDPG